VRKPALLAFSLPLAAVGTLAGHAAGYALVGGSQHHVHGYLAFAPEFLAVCVAMLAAGLALRAGGRLRGSPSAWIFALLPPLAFVAQELIERIVAGLPAHAVFEPAVVAGLAAQAPVALLAYLAARTLLRVADEAGEAIAPRISLHLAPAGSVLPMRSPPPPSAGLAYGRLGRAPPC
jgi:hypothetical protein